MKRYHFSEVDSTNNWAKKNLSKFNRSEITLITAEHQTGGRGRYERKWISPPNVNLYATYVFCSDEKPQDLCNKMALAIKKILISYGFSPTLKWPNDVLISGKKIAGILCETKDDYIILGVGLNVNMTKEINVDQPFTSMLIESGKEFEIEKIIQHLGSQLDRDKL